MPFIGASYGVVLLIIKGILPDNFDFIYLIMILFAIYFIGMMSLFLYDRLTTLRPFEKNSEEAIRKRLYKLISRDGLSNEKTNEKLYALLIELAEHDPATAEILKRNELL